MMYLAAYNIDIGKWEMYREITSFKIPDDNFTLYVFNYNSWE